MRFFQNNYCKFFLVINIFLAIITIYFSLMMKVNDVYQEKRVLEIKYLDISDEYKKYSLIKGKTEKLNVSAMFMGADSEIYFYSNEDGLQLRISISKNLIDNEEFHLEFQKLYENLINILKADNNKNQIIKYIDDWSVLFIKSSLKALKIKEKN